MTPVAHDQDPYLEEDWQILEEEFGRICAVEWTQQNLTRRSQACTAIAQRALEGDPPPAPVIGHRAFESAVMWHGASEILRDSGLQASIDFVMRFWADGSGEA